MVERLVIGLLGNSNSGKSYTWHQLFNRSVKTGTHPRELKLRCGECVEVFLISGSFEETGKRAREVLGDQNCRIILCSMQYSEDVRKTLEYFVQNNFSLYIQWLNPGYKDSGPIWDRLGLVNEILSMPSAFTMRNGKEDTNARVQELREVIYGWAKYRDLIYPC